jgi:hypothetical protein
MRTFFLYAIVFCLLYFIFGWVAVQLDWVTRDTYFAWAGIVGSLASVVGLLAATRPSMTSSDLQTLEIEALKSLTSTSEELKSLQSAREKMNPPPNFADRVCP